MSGRARLLYIHASEDEALRRALEAHLSALRQEGSIEGWHVGQMPAGAAVGQHLAGEVAQADIVLLLLSADFMASLQCQALLQQVQQARTTRGLKVVPIVARPVDFRGLGLDGVQVLPRNGQAVTLWPSQDAAWLEVAEALRGLVTGDVSPPAAAPGLSTSTNEWTMNSDESGSDNSIGIKLTPEEKKTAAGRRKMKPLFLYALWKVSGGNPLYFVNMFELGAELGLDKSETHTIVGRLVDDIHVQNRTSGGGISITNYGAEHVEEHAEDLEEMVHSTRAAQLKMEVTVDRSITIHGGSVTGSALVTGDGNQVNVHYQHSNLPPPESVDLRAELRAIQEILTALQSSDKRRIERALEEATEEAEQSSPRKEVIGESVEKALTIAKQAGTFIEAADKLRPHVASLTAWLGAAWHKLLPIVGSMV